MSTKRLHRSIELFHPFGWLLTGLLLLTPWSALADVHELCSQAGGLTLDTTFRSHEGDRACYRIDVPSPGILTLDASAPGSPEAEPRLVFLGSGPGGGVGAVRHRTVWETPRGVIVEVEDSGSVFVIVAPEDPVLALAGYKLRNAFVDEDAVFGEAVSRGLEAAGICLPGSEDVDEEDCDILERASKAPASDQLGAFLALCSGDESDDHGDTPLCATPLELGGSATGTIDNRAGDDEDFFTLVVDELRSVRIGAVAAHLTLYDGKGQRLASSVEGVEASYLVRALSPGRYYLRLQSFWGSGDTYVLSLEDLDVP